MMARTLFLPACVSICLVLTGSSFGAADSGTVRASSGVRIVHFPADRSLGKLMSRPAKPEEPVNAFRNGFHDSDWESLGEAKGDVSVPAGHEVSLLVTRPAEWRDLSPLLKLQPDDLYKLGIHGSYSGGSKPGDSCMGYVAYLTGLHALDLANTGISGAAMKHVTALKELQWLTVPGRMDDKGMALIAEMPWLTGLYFKENLVTNAGLAHLAKLTSLEEMELGGARITDAGLTHLAGLPRLRSLLLWGRGFTDSGFKSLTAIPHLETLNLNALDQVTDAGLVHLSQVPQLKDLDLYRATRVTDTGLAHLKKLPHLRSLNLWHAAVTDAGLAHLKEIKTLECLMLPDRGITDKGFYSLAELTRLRELHVPRPHYVDPKMNKDFYTDEGVKAISRLISMEKLSLAGIGVTDEGIRHLASMTHLKDLDLFGCDRLTDESVKVIAGLRSLDTLRITHGRLTVSGLRSLNNLSNLTNLKLQEVVQDNSGLALSGLVNLRDLSFGLARKQANGDAAMYQEQDIAAMGRLVNLRRLQISHSGIPSDAVMRHLTGLTHLERLSIGGNGLTDDGVAYLAQLPSLTSLTLSGTFTDSALRHLRKLENLGLLDFMSGANFTARALSDFRTSMPNLVTYRDFEKR